MASASSAASSAARAASKAPKRQPRVAGSARKTTQTAGSKKAGKARLAGAAKEQPDTARPRPAKAATSKPARVKLVRDSFTMPEADVDLLATMKARCLKLGHEVKKSELLRAGLHALAAMPDEALLTAASAVPRLKTGRPGHKKGKS